MGKTIEIKCDVEGHEGEAVQFKREGWKFKHLRVWQNALVKSSITVGELAGFVSERIAGWTLKADDGKPVEFKPIKEILDDKGKPAFEPNDEAFDELPPLVSQFVVSALKQAYYESQTPDPLA